jgi:hypothetical protein
VLSFYFLLQQAPRSQCWMFLTKAPTRLSQQNLCGINTQRESFNERNWWTKPVSQCFTRMFRRQMFFVFHSSLCSRSVFSLESRSTDVHVIFLCLWNYLCSVIAIWNCKHFKVFKTRFKVEVVGLFDLTEDYLVTLESQSD